MGILSDIAAVLLGLGLLFGTLALAAPRRGGRRLRTRSVRFLGHFALLETRHPATALVLTALAAATIGEVAGPITAAVVGLICGLLDRHYWVLDAAGAAGSLALFVVVLGFPGSTVPPAHFVMLVALTGVGVVVGRIASTSRALTTLALFGLLDLVRFAAAPFGVGWETSTASTWMIVAGVLVCAGFVVGSIPRLGIALLAVATAYAELAGALALPVTAEYAAEQGARFIAIVAFTFSYVVAHRFRE